VVAHELSPQPHRALLERRLTLLLAAAEEERPFLRWYARRLARITERAADEARLSADAAAVRSAGGAARARGLRGWEETPGTWDEFWHRRVQPELETGRRPPLAAGMREHVRRALRDPSAGGEDALLAEIEPLEAELLARVAGAERAETLEPETWVTPFADLPAPDPGAEPEAPARRALELPAFEVRLVTPLRARAAAVTVLVLGCGCLIPFAAIFVLAPLRGWIQGTVPALICGALAATSLICLALIAWRQAAVLGRSGRAVSAGGALRVEHPRLLRSPLTIASDRVRAIVVDPDGDERFPVRPASPWERPHEGGDEPLGYLWTATYGAALPIFDLTAHAPNVAVVLEDPVLGPEPRRQHRHGPLRGERLQAFLLRVDRPAALAAALEAAGLPRELRAGDLPD
jgi:hypothetical protein